MGNIDSSPNTVRVGVWDVNTCNDVPNGAEAVASVVQGWDLFVLINCDLWFGELVAQKTGLLVFHELEYTLLYSSDVALHPLGSYEYALTADGGAVTAGSGKEKEDDEGFTLHKIMVAEIRWFKSVINLFVGRFVIQNTQQEEYIKKEVIKKILDTVDAHQRSLFIANFDVQDYRLFNQKLVSINSDTSGVITQVRPNLFTECCNHSDWRQCIHEPTTIWSFKPRSGTWDNILYHRLHLYTAEVVTQPREHMLSTHHAAKAIFKLNDVESDSEISDETSFEDDADDDGVDSESESSNSDIAPVDTI